MLSFVCSFALSEQYARFRFMLALFLFLLILILGNLPGARADVGQYASGVALHTAAYSTITFLLFSGYRGTPIARATVAVLVVAGMGALDEYVQSFFPYRGASVGDWLVDIAASVFASMLLWLFFPRNKAADQEAVKFQ